LLIEWDYEKNRLNPEKITYGTQTKVWWKCSKGHSWSAQVSTRTRLGVGCPYCAGLKVWSGFNDLAIKRPDLAKEWHPTRNQKQPNEVGFGPTKHWWICPSGHEYFASASNRAAGMGCSRCAKYGYDTTQAGVFYFIQNQELQARKMGIANQTSKRLNEFAKRGWVVNFTVESSNGNAILDLETAMFRWLRKEIELPVHLAKRDMQRMAGFTETFGMDKVTNDEVIEKISTVWQKVQG
jgi:hypothetical protein